MEVQTQRIAVQHLKKTPECLSLGDLWVAFSGIILKRTGQLALPETLAAEGQSHGPCQCHKLI